MARMQNSGIAADIPVKIDQEVEDKLKEYAIEHGLVFYSRNAVLRDMFGLPIKRKGGK